MSSLFPASFEVNSLESIYCYAISQSRFPSFNSLCCLCPRHFRWVHSPFYLPMKLLLHEANVASLSYTLVLMYIYATLQPTRLLTYLLKRLHLHFLRSMHSQDVTRLILLVTSRNNRSCFRLHVLLYDWKSSSLTSIDEAESSFFDPACIT